MAQRSFFRNENPRRLHVNVFSFLNHYTVESLISGQTRDSISTVLYHSIRFKSPNDQCGAPVEIESRHCPDTSDSIVIPIESTKNDVSLAV